MKNRYNHLVKNHNLYCNLSPKHLALKIVFIGTHRWRHTAIKIKSSQMHPVMPANILFYDVENTNEETATYMFEMTDLQIDKF